MAYFQNKYSNFEPKLNWEINPQTVTAFGIRSDRWVEVKKGCGKRKVVALFSLTLSLTTESEWSVSRRVQTSRNHQKNPKEIHINRSAICWFCLLLPGSLFDSNKGLFRASILCKMQMPGKQILSVLSLVFYACQNEIKCKNKMHK